MTTTPQESEPEGPDAADGTDGADGDDGHDAPEAAPWSDGQEMEQADVMMDPEEY